MAFILPLPTFPWVENRPKSRDHARADVFSAPESLAKSPERPENATKTPAIAAIEAENAGIEAENASKTLSMAGIEAPDALETPSIEAIEGSIEGFEASEVSETSSLIVREARFGLIAGHEALWALDAEADDAAEAARPANTARAYALELACFASWARRNDACDCPAEPRTVRAYLRELAKQGRDPADVPSGRPKGPFGYSALMRTLAAICSMHVKEGHDSLWTHPVIAEARNTHARELGKAPKSQKRDLSGELLCQVCDLMGDNLIGLRDRTMLLLGWEGGGRRRSEIAAAQIGHFEPIEGTEHIKWKIPRSKTDQTGAGLVVPIMKHATPAYCPVEAFRNWMEASEIRVGPLLRVILPDGTVSHQAISPEFVSKRIKFYVEKLGLDPKRFGGHSIRSGFITTAYRHGRKLPDIMEATGHHKYETAMGYIRRSGLEDSAAKGLMEEVASKTEKSK